jgi:hypothetical protein
LEAPDWSEKYLRAVAWGDLPKGALAADLLKLFNYFLFKERKIYFGRK